jgi:hypothetical protein
VVDASLDFQSLVRGHAVSGIDLIPSGQRGISPIYLYARVVWIGRISLQCRKEIEDGRCMTIHVLAVTSVKLQKLRNGLIGCRFCHVGIKCP